MEVNAGDPDTRREEPWLFARSIDVIHRATPELAEQPTA
jgi:hypothetical protein